MTATDNGSNIRALGNNKAKAVFGISDIFNFFMLFTTLSSFTVLFYKNITIRHVVVFLGGSAFYFLALKRMLSVHFKIGQFLRLLFMLIILIFGIFVTAKEITWELIYACLNFYCLYMFVSTDNEFTISRHFYKWNGRIFLLIAFVLIALSFSPVAYLTESGDKNDALTLGATNPNLTAMLISGVFSMLLINFNNMKYKPILVVIMGYLLYLIWLTEARSALLAIVFLLIYALFYKDKKIPPFMMLAVILIPVIFCYVYLQLWYTGLEDFVFLGKDFFSGREIVFVEALESLKTTTDYLFGKMIFANAHNAPLEIFRSVGFFGLLLFYWDFIKHLMGLNKVAVSRASRLAIVCILGVCLQTSAEAAMLLGIFPTSAFMYFYFLMASDANNNIMATKQNETVEIS